MPCLKEHVASMFLPRGEGHFVSMHIPGEQDDTSSEEGVPVQSGTVSTADSGLGSVANEVNSFSNPHKVTFLTLVHCVAGAPVLCGVT